MNITAYPLTPQPAPLHAAPTERAWLTGQATLATQLACDRLNGLGWQVLCPYAFEATWNGGTNPEDLAIRVDMPHADQPVFVQSQLGGGILTMHTGYQIKTDDGYALWVRGPINAPKDGLAPLESLAETSVLPCTVTIHCQVTRPHHTIHFAAGEPFGTLLPVPIHDLDTLAVDVVPLGEEVERYEQDFHQMAQAPALQRLFERLGATAAEPPAAAPSHLVPDRRAPSSWAAQLRHPPPVSCLCPTYGRVELLEEAISAFLQQDYPGQKELIVLNDYADQTLVFDHPEVRIINVPRRFHSVGEKYKAAAALASHDLLFVWHDDDISLPHRLSFTVAQMAPAQGFFKADKAWMWDNGQLSGLQENVFHGGSCWRRDLFVTVHGYPHIGVAYDVEGEHLCTEEAPAAVAIHPISPADVYYLYRWRGTGSYHLSALGQDGEAQQAVAAFVQRQADQGHIRRGEIPLTPRWQTDYVARVHEYLAAHPAMQQTWQQDYIPFPPPFATLPPPSPLPASAAASLFTGDSPVTISVIVPACNESVLLQRTVEQLAATLPANSEIIVVDNGSQDGCADFLGQEARAGVQLIRTPTPLGVAGARNRGLAQAHGEVVVFADAHLDLPERWWQPIVALLNRPHVGVVGPGIGVMGKPDSQKMYGQRIADTKLRVEWLPWQRAEPYPVPTLGGGFMAMRHETLTRAGAFDTGMPQWGSEDLELCVRYWLLGYEVWVVPEVTVLHYFRHRNPYKVAWQSVAHNLLRVALLHFNEARLARVVGALKTDAKFAQALAQAVASDVWQQRATFAARRVRDDDWYFRKFQDSCPV